MFIIVKQINNKNIIISKPLPYYEGYELLKTLKDIQPNVIYKLIPYDKEKKEGPQSKRH